MNLAAQANCVRWQIKLMLGRLPLAPLCTRRLSAAMGLCTIVCALRTTSTTTARPAHSPPQAPQSPWVCRLCVELAGRFVHWGKVA